MFVLSLTAFAAVTRKDPPVTLITVLLPMAPAAAAWRVPLLIVVVPLNVVAPARVWVPLPFFTRLPVPEMPPL